MNLLLPGYNIRRGSTLDRALLVKFMQRTYQDMFPGEDFSHLVRTVEQYFSNDTPLWWVDFVGLLGDKEDKEDKGDKGDKETKRQGDKKEFAPSSPPLPPSSSPVACLWVGNSIDQVRGDRHAHIFLLYVLSEHRRRGIGKALMQYVENWAFIRGDRQIGLQVFKSNQPALNLYNQLGYQTQSLWMVKSLDYKKT
ncbi:GCN5-related N-acetyltransferase [Tolypothrix sp. NIES-4075]|uniref:GNAT family N-acetyltransferase n=1 Tax=Tolypothrix sp. NIES-4075 TaxID=2005459 RepID=UPI000B6BC087|nr:GNAT family N-acetyltransferase [Tolypothrix sp. NIES-4075]GAX43469.1 GCN5-related N-acetyltransferase [Tolypothrix sp. NIES-4075]